MSRLLVKELWDLANDVTSKHRKVDKSGETHAFFPACFAVLIVGHLLYVLVMLLFAKDTGHMARAKAVVQVTVSLTICFIPLCWGVFRKSHRPQRKIETA